MEPHVGVDNRYRLQFLISKTQLWVSILTLLILLIGLFTQHTQIVNVVSLILREKPLEGIWRYESTYTKYYDGTDYEEKNPNELYGKGQAIITWKDAKKQYDVYITYGVYRPGNSKAILAAALSGYISDIDDKGFPINSNFEIKDLKILNRVHYKNADPSKDPYTFTNCNINKSIQRTDKINCDFMPHFSSSKVSLTWNDSLH